MKSKVRFIARLDIKGPNVIKGIQFDGHRVVGEPEHLAKLYYQEGIDELIFQDTVASLYRRNSVLEIVRKTAQTVFIPMTVAGGIRSIEDARVLLRAGADKVGVNTAAVENPGLLTELANTFGSQCVVASLEVHLVGPGRWEIWTDYGRQRTGVDALEWASRVRDLGAGEILLTSVDNEGMGRGYDYELIAAVTARVDLPVIASGGAGSREDVVRAVEAGADAVAAASILHYRYLPLSRKQRPVDPYRFRMGEHVDHGNTDFMHHGYGGSRDVPVEPVSIGEVKAHMVSRGVPTRVASEG